MTILTQVRQDRLQARKSRDTIAVNVLTTLVGEAEAIGKNAGNRETTDLGVIAIVKKFMKNMDETISVVKHPETLADLRRERSIIEKYLLTQLGAAELREHLVALASEVNAVTLRDVGKVMKVLKERFDGQYDGANASTLIKEILA